MRNTGRGVKRSLLPILLLLAWHSVSLHAVKAGGQVPNAAANKRFYTPLIDSAAGRYGVDAALLHALIKVESNYDPMAVSRAGAIGLMQLMPETAVGYGVESREALFDPATNLDAGTRHLKRLLRKYKNISLALTAYNAGEGSAVRFRRTGAYTETRKYVVRVIRYYQIYKGRKK